LNVNTNRRNGYDQINTSRELGTDSLLQQFSRTITPGNGLYLGAGMNRELNTKLTIGLDTRININRSRSENENPTDIFRKSNSQVFFSTLSQTENNAKSLNTNIAFNAKYKIDTIGSELNQDLSYSFDPTQNEQTLDNRFLLPFVSQQQLEGDAKKSITFYHVSGKPAKKIKRKINC